MRLKTSKVSAEEELVNLVLQGYTFIDKLVRNYDVKKREADLSGDPLIGKFFTPLFKEYNEIFDLWEKNVERILNSIFPTGLEAFSFHYYRITPNEIDAFLSGIQGLINKWVQKIDVIQNLIDRNLLRYTELPLTEHLFVEDIDSFRKVRDVNPSIVSNLLVNGRLDIAEDFIQTAFEQIVDESFHKKDWGGEGNDLFTTNINVQGTRIATAFMLKGNGLKKSVMEIKDCGKNGDQIVRLFEAPAELFIVQFIGTISENVIKDVKTKVELKREKGKRAWFCIINGQDTARLLRAYGKL